MLPSAFFSPECVRFAWYLESALLFPIGLGGLKHENVRASETHNDKSQKNSKTYIMRPKKSELFNVVAEKLQRKWKKAIKWLP